MLIPDQKKWINDLSDTDKINIVSVIEKNYGIRHAKILRKAISGTMSNNFIIRSGEIKYFLKRYRSKDKKFINKIINVEFFFYNSGIPVILPLKTGKNDFLFYYKRHFYSLFLFVDCKNLKKKNLSDKHLKSAAGILAAMHLLSGEGSPKIVSKFIKKYEKDRFLSRARKMLQVIRKKKYKTKFDNLAEKDVILKISLAVKNKKKFNDFPLRSNHLIHGDFQEMNLFFGNDGKISYVYDFEQAIMSPRSLEIVRAMDIMCFDGDFKAENFKNASIFLKEYNKNYPIKKEELIAGIELWFFKKLHSLWMEEEHYIKNNFRVDRFMAREIKKIKYFSSNMRYFTEFINDILSKK